MTDEIKHECGIALVRLLKPLDFYQKKYGSWKYGLQKLYLLMEKQHNRGQDGAGIVSVKLNLDAGKKYLHSEKSFSEGAIQEIFTNINKNFNNKNNSELYDNAEWAKNNIPFVSELYLGHLRYATFGKNDIEHVHPVIRENNWKSKNLAIAGNFNLTNVDELFQQLINLGQHPKNYTDTVTVLEKIGHCLDRENERIYRLFKEKGFTNINIAKEISNSLNLTKILKEASENWDGGYVVAGVIGHGDAFVVRDPNGIRPAWYYYDDEIVVVTSERPVIQTTLNVRIDKVKELNPGEAIIVKKDGTISFEVIKESKEKKSCSFERIYFSRGTDRDVYIERKDLGKKLCPTILKSINYDLDNTVFSYIPNTAEVAFYGLIEELNVYCNKVKYEKIVELQNKSDKETIEKILMFLPRIERLAVKDIKLRTFITQDKGRNDLVGHVYDVTYGIVKDYVDTMVVIDDSIVRGTTLKECVLNMLDKLYPKKIIIVSSAPQIRYPDCYGIDMAKLGDLIAFKATIELLKENNQEKIITEVYELSKAQQNLPKEKIINYVKKIYKPFTAEQISTKIAEILKPPFINADVEIIYQSIESLHSACPGNKGDWYFTGDYPTPGGNKVVNTSFINYMEGKNQRAY
jgi:amidophosphoribosyltransferase